MSTVLLHFATGAAFFSGMLLANLAAVPAFWLRGRRLKKALAGIAALGILFVILSGTPMRWYAYGIWLAVAAASVATAYSAILPRHIGRFRIALAGFLVATTIVLGAVEARHRRAPNIEAEFTLPVYVIGDSLSAGMGAGTTLWPEVYARESGRTVVNLAEPGATLCSALRQAKKLPDVPALVILEIGGNDLLGGTRSADFREELDRLLLAASGRGRRLVMFELPLPPFHAAFGKAQRSLAAKHVVTMIPKRCLGAAFGLKVATLDGLHFSQVGHDYMAELMTRVLSEAAPASD